MKVLIFIGALIYVALLCEDFIQTVKDKGLYLIFILGIFVAAWAAFISTFFR